MLSMMFFFSFFFLTGISSFHVFLFHPGSLGSVSARELDCATCDACKGSQCHEDCLRTSQCGRWKTFELSRDQTALAKKKAELSAKRARVTNSRAGDKPSKKATAVKAKKRKNKSSAPIGCVTKKSKASRKQVTKRRRATPVSATKPLRRSKRT